VTTFVDYMLIRQI